MGYITVRKLLRFYLNCFKKVVIILNGRFGDRKLRQNEPKYTTVGRIKEEFRSKNPSVEENKHVIAVEKNTVAIK